MSYRLSTFLDFPSGVCRSKVLSSTLKDYLSFGVSPGVFTLQPILTRSIQKLNKIISKLMQDIEAQQVLMPCLIPLDMWRTSGRLSSAGDELFRIFDRTQREYCLAPTHEECISSLIASKQPFSDKKLPIRLFQITTKFRDEIRPRYGLLRAKEFIMKDLYTFDTDEVSAKATYDEVCSVYDRLLSSLSLSYQKVLGDPGNIGDGMSHEYHLLSPIGEDTVLTCHRCNFAFNINFVNQENSAVSTCSSAHLCCPKCSSSELSSQKGIEVAHTFLLGTKYSKPFNAYFDVTGNSGLTGGRNKKRLLEMGCYGIGISRLVSASLEIMSTDNTLSWPEQIIPYQICFVPLRHAELGTKALGEAESLRQQLLEQLELSGEILIDDRLQYTIGFRLRELKTFRMCRFLIVIGKQFFSDTPLLEVIDCASNRVHLLSFEHLIQWLCERTQDITRIS